ncbi:MAG: hypothetical protein KOO62_04635 [candidate division Zixibacteria bacterium]|nr:hypothetical protein [candidate division Zixibacteria bacterium]
MGGAGADVETEDSFDLLSWRNSVGRWTSIVEQLGWSRTFIGRIAGALDKGPLSDADLPAFLSVLLVEVRCDGGRNDIVVTPVFLRHVNDLFAHLPKDQIVRLQDDTNELVSMKAVNNCLQEPVFL